MRNQWTWLLAGAVVVVAAVMPAGAAITGITAADDHDGKLSCTFNSETDWHAAGSEFEMNLAGDQYGGPGHILGVISTDTELDPILKIFNSIDNDTTFAWTSYQVNFSMTKPFTLSSVSGPAGWGVSYMPFPYSALSNTITFTMPVGGTPIAIGDSIDFSFKATFLGAASYTEELIPTPEPATMGVLVLGGLAVLVKRRRR